MNKRGGINFKAGDKEYTLRFSINAIAAFETGTGVNFQDGLKKLETGSVALLRDFFAAGLVGGGHDCTTLEAGDIMDAIVDVEGLEGTFNIVIKAVEFAFSKNDQEAPAGKQPPRKRQPKKG